MINTFGNITTTNQQDYTLIKNTTEAAMNDAIDWGSYSGGFYLCVLKNDVKKTNGVYQFEDKSQYEIRRIINGVNVNTSDLSDDGKCEFLEGETIIHKDVFVESFLRRFAADVNNNKSYQVTVQEVIEYPPKVSVRIDTFNTFNSSQATTETYYEGNFNISNQIDSIFEEKE